VCVVWFIISAEMVTDGHATTSFAAGGAPSAAALSSAFAASSSSAAAASAITGACVFAPFSTVKDSDC
jgi:hypothetical protein